MPKLRDDNNGQEFTKSSAARDTTSKTKKSNSKDSKKSGSFAGANEYLITDEDAPFLFKESFKTLRTNIMFSLIESGPKVIGVTSGEKGDGKSTVLLNTAISFAELGKHVLVIDCDLRLPSIASTLGVPNVPGLTDMMIGNCNPSDALHKNIHYLDVFTAGTIPGDSTGIISSKRMRVLLDNLKKMYEYIFLDLPPVTTVTDAAILADAIDGFMLVVRHNKTENKSIKEMLRLMKMSNANVLGFVYNDAEITVKKGYYKYYKYK